MGNYDQHGTDEVQIAANFPIADHREIAFRYPHKLSTRYATSSEPEYQHSGSLLVA
jgi:hypothetical protein